MSYGQGHWLLHLVPRLARIPGLVRVSVGIKNEVSKVDRFIEVLEKIDRASNSITRNDLAYSLQTNVKEHMEEFYKMQIQKIYSRH